MSRYLLDTNICIAWLKNNQAVVQRIIEAGENHIYLCAPVKAELWYGACKSQRVNDNKANLELLFSYFPSLPFDDHAALHFGESRSHLATQGTPIGPYDLQIVAIGLSHQLTVVTNNTREFERVPMLMLADWLS